MRRLFEGAAYLSVYSAPQYEHFAQPLPVIARYTRGCEFHRNIPGIGQDNGKSAAVSV